MTPHRRRHAAAAALAVALGMGCADTTVDPTVTEPADGTTTVASVPTGPAAELLGELLAELAGLSERVVDNEGDEESMTRIAALWEAARGEVEVARRDLLVAFDSSIALARTAVERRRPADADKAYRNLAKLVDEFVGDE